MDPMGNANTVYLILKADAAKDLALRTVEVFPTHRILQREKEEFQETRRTQSFRINPEAQMDRR
jgi:hypothetical protein